MVQVAILLGYNGRKYDGSARTNGSNSIEGILLQKLTKILNCPVSGISRSNTTEPGEHAAKQVLSCEFKDIPIDKVPTVEELNRNLPSDIRIYKIIVINSVFSARKNCEAKTFEYLIPTYVFTPPPEATEYCFAPLTEPDDDFIIEQEPQGGLFNPKRSQSLARRRTLKKAMQYSSPEPLQIKTSETPANSERKKSFFSKIFGKWFGKKKQPSGSEQLKAVLNNTLRRADTSKSIETIGEESLVATLKRGLSNKGKDVIKQDTIDLENDAFDGKLCEPLNIPPPTDNILKHLKQFRLSEKQKHNIRSTLAMFNGTHNWHNYIPNSTQDDARNFMRVINVDVSVPEVHFGLEWVRIKTQVHNAAKYQIRKMMSMLIMVVRTNTPRAVVANSFGIQRIDIPDAPGTSLILDEPHYNTFNADAVQAGNQPVNFGEANEHVEKFSKDFIYNDIFVSEETEMEFEKWIRNIDCYSFLYTQYLNQNGVITKARNAIKQ